MPNFPDGDVTVFGTTRPPNYPLCSLGTRHSPFGNNPMFRLLFLTVLFAGCSRAPDQPSAAASKLAPVTIEASTLQSYLDAFNRHDPEAVTALLATNVKWFSVESEKLAPEAESRDAVRTWLTSYFKAQPDVRAEYLSLEQTGIIVAVRERVTWTAPNKKIVQQQSHALFEIRQGLIHRVWYFPAARQP